MHPADRLRAAPGYRNRIGAGRLSAPEAGRGACPALCAPRLGSAAGDARRADDRRFDLYRPARRHVARYRRAHRIGIGDHRQGERPRTALRHSGRSAAPHPRRALPSRPPGRVGHRDRACLWRALGRHRRGQRPGRTLCAAIGPSHPDPKRREAATDARRTRRRVQDRPGRHRHRWRRARHSGQCPPDAPDRVGQEAAGLDGRGRGTDRAQRPVHLAGGERQRRQAVRRWCERRAQ